MSFGSEIAQCSIRQTKWTTKFELWSIQTEFRAGISHFWLNLHEPTVKPLLFHVSTRRIFDFERLFGFSAPISMCIRWTPLPFRVIFDFEMFMSSKNIFYCHIFFCSGYFVYLPVDWTSVRIRNAHYLVIKNWCV